MEQPYDLVFDSVIIKQLKKSSKNKNIKMIISKMLNKIGSQGPFAGKLLDSKLLIYEIKNNHPPIRLYFKQKGMEIHIFKFDMKTSKEKQQRTIDIIRKKLESKVFSTKLFLFNVLFKLQKPLVNLSLFQSV